MTRTLRVFAFLSLLALPAALAPAAQAQGTPAAREAVTTDVPTRYVLSAAYPNPFNPQTTFSLKLDKEQEVKVEVYNLLGLRVRQLYTGPMEAGETRTFTFEAESLPSGIYLYRAQGEDFIATRQVTLLK